MREIKFRGMTLGQEWVYGWLSYLPNKLDGVEPGYYMANAHGCPHAYALRPETIGQYTGLKDKNGKEIYEGDIVKSPHFENEMIVEYDVLSASDDMSAPGIGFQFNTFLEDMEVIGNIYENPELMEGEE